MALFMGALRGKAHSVCAHACLWRACAFAANTKQVITSEKWLVNCLPVVCDWVMGPVHTIWMGAIIHVAPHIHYVLRQSVSIVKKMTGSSVGRAQVTILCPSPLLTPSLPTPNPTNHSLHCVSAGSEHPAATEM